MKKYPFSKMTGLFSLGLGTAVWYTLKIDWMEKENQLSAPGHPLLTWWDPLLILEVSAFLFLVLSLLIPHLSRISWKRKPGQGHRYFKRAVLFMMLWQLPFLLTFYPVPGMNDTLFMMKNPLYGSVQFPWLYSMVYGYGTAVGKFLFGTAEPVIFLLSLLQLLVMSLGLTAFCFWMKNHVHPWAGWGLYGYFTFLPMVGNYAIAAVRDGLFSLAVLLWMWLFLWLQENPTWTKKKYVLLGAALVGTMLLRSNGVLVSVILTWLTVYFYGNKKIWLPCAFCALLAIVPARVIQQVNHWEPLFQESMAIPLQQLGRTMVTGGERSEETKALMDGLLEEEKWKKAYLPYTVDFVKWHDDFHRNQLNQEKEVFLRAWVETGLANPRIYVEGWLTETYSLWNLDPVAFNVQSRFGWAMSDENTKDMKSADNDRMAVGSLPLPMKVKSLLANVQWEGSRFLGAGLCLWLTLFYCLLFYHQKKKGYLVAMPLLLNTFTLLLSTPASAVFRYSFAYVLGLPVMVLLVVFAEEK